MRKTEDSVKLYNNSKKVKPHVAVPVINAMLIISVVVIMLALVLKGYATDFAMVLCSKVLDGITVSVTLGKGFYACLIYVVLVFVWEYIGEQTFNWEFGNYFEISKEGIKYFEFQLVNNIQGKAYYGTEIKSIMSVKQKKNYIILLGVFEQKGAFSKANTFKKLKVSKEYEEIDLILAALNNMNKATEFEKIVNEIRGKVTESEVA